MKILIYILTFIALTIAATFFVLVYRQQNTAAPVPIETPAIEETETEIAKRLLLEQIDTRNLNPEEKELAEASARQQVEDDARLYDMAVAAGTTVPESLIQFAWLREEYNHTDAAGLAAYIASLGLTEEKYRALVLRRLTTATFIESKAAERVSDEDIRKYYDALPPEEREDFEIMSLEIRENLIGIEAAKVRKELLTQ
ncbi:MAG: hypothetical protein ACK4SL_01215 [Candidatus Paceibacteria bacterium]